MEDTDDPGISDATVASMYLTLELKGKGVVFDTDVSSSLLFRYCCFQPPKARENISACQDVSGPSLTGQHSRYEVPSKMEAFRSADFLA